MAAAAAVAVVVVVAAAAVAAVAAVFSFRKLGMKADIEKLWMQFATVSELQSVIQSVSHCGSLAAC